MDVPATNDVSEWKAEQEWLKGHSEAYSGQWVALRGDCLLSHGSDARSVRDEARAKGVHLPLLVHIPDEPTQLSGGWL